MGKTRGRRSDRSDGTEQKLYLQLPLLEMRVPEPDLIFLTDLPGGLDSKEWIASHTIGFFEHINLMYGTVSEFCTPSTCPDMTGPGNRQYHWIDDKGKKARLSAPQYIDYIMTYAQKSINDDTIFPTKHGLEFPATFESHVKKIHKLLFHVLAHIYHMHFKEVVLLQLHAHLNAVFAHFVEFNLRFHMVEDKELEVLDDLMVALKLTPPKQSGSNGTLSAVTAGTADSSITDEENKENIGESQPMTTTSGSTTGEVICSQPLSQFPPVEPGGTSSEPQSNKSDPPSSQVDVEMSADEVSASPSS
ncbi:hypothetical protein TCAL_02227 [Tigriopus californicus]|uniref:MOB kinase activator-like 2 n=1 Tax=Tigriopus californicus TaxID=6832 RepID=A0A553P687_TIGCA|nr:MOB kinase activator-like 2 isoform X2 [Tigriopus californicus]TRY73205.1 hypothetical protein TCAL_02227 [Tigriopus californicus]